jgi:hypothetical protein
LFFTVELIISGGDFSKLIVNLACITWPKLRIQLFCHSRAGGNQKKYLKIKIPDACLAPAGASTCPDKSGATTRRDRRCGTIGTYVSFYGEDFLLISALKCRVRQTVY